jgi:serine/threonine protein kinase
VAVKVALPLLRALAKLHAVGIVHRHIRPEHLLISSGQLLLGDLSVAAITRDVVPGCAALAGVAAQKPGQAAARVSVELLASSVADPVHGAVVVDTRMASSSTLSHVASSSRFADMAGTAAEEACGSSSEPVDVLNHRVGSIEYMAPEMLNKPTSAEVFHLVSSAADDGSWWSMLCGDWLQHMPG